MDIKAATRAYEAWLGKRIPLSQTDLRRKHQRMAEGPFPFLRATFYRWVQLWPKVCPVLAAAPAVLGVGDLHVENFGTWRDSEGRLVWGVNDFDEVAWVPYTNDLVRLAVSALLAISENHLSCDPADACEAILKGYHEGLDSGGAPFVLAEQHRSLRELAMTGLRDPTIYWPKLDQLPTVGTGLPAPVKAALKNALPRKDLPFRVVHRQAGLGSLGRRRFTVLAEWRGGRIAREAKELVVSAWHWENDSPGQQKILYARAIDQAVRVPDPFVTMHKHWVLRRLAPDCSRIELGMLPRTKDELKLLVAMGWETANIHLGSKPAVRRVSEDLRQRSGKWLRKAAEAMTKATLEDWKEWVRS